METLRQDLSYGVRALLKNRGFVQDVSEILPPAVRTLVS